MAGAGLAMSAMGQMQQGQAAADAADYNVKMGEIAAADAYERAETDKQLLAHDFLKTKATGQTQTAGGNIRIGTGSSLDWENDLIDTYISDKAGVDLNTSREVSGIRNQQTLDAVQGKSARNASRIGAAGSLLAGAAKTGSVLYTPKGA